MSPLCAAAATTTTVSSFVIVLLLVLSFADVVNCLGLVDFTRVIFQFPHTETATDPVTAYTVLGVGLSIVVVGFYLGIIPREFRLKRSPLDDSTTEDDHRSPLTAILDMMWELDSMDGGGGGCLTTYLCHSKTTSDNGHLFSSSAELLLKQTLQLFLRLELNSICESVKPTDVPLFSKRCRIFGEKLRSTIGNFTKYIEVL